ncbi:STAS domain-containing protein [bacterium]|nr:STAS domain-containing protein [bacterium]
MKVLEEKIGNVYNVKISGKLDATTSGEFDTNLTRIVDSGEIVLAIDFSGLDYISSAGLRIFLILLKKIKKADGKLACHSMNDNVKEVFVISGFSSIIPIFPTAEEAQSSFE